MPLKEKWTKIEPKLEKSVIESIIKALGFSYMMPVQKATIPYFINNYDVAVEVHIKKI